MYMKIKEKELIYGHTYMPGYIGFTYSRNSIISILVAWFSRSISHIKFLNLDKKNKKYAKVSHTFIVIDETTIIEAHAMSGVSYAKLSKYTEDKNCDVYFRRPLGYNKILGSKIVKSAQRHLGENYDYGLIIADLLSSTFIGRTINRAFFNIPKKLLSYFLDTPKAQICSEVASKALKDQQKLKNKGILKTPAREITPQMLFDSDKLFGYFAFKVKKC